MIRRHRQSLPAITASAVLLAASILGFLLLSSIAAFSDWQIPGVGDDEEVVTALTGPSPAAQTIPLVAFGDPLVSGGQQTSSPRDARGGRDGEGAGGNGINQQPGLAPADPGSNPSDPSLPAEPAPDDAPEGSPDPSPPNSAGAPPPVGGPGLAADAVNQVDGLTGGALSQTGVIQLADQALETVTAPDTPVGAVIEQATTGATVVVLGITGH